MKGMVIDVEVWIKRRGGERDVILTQDPRSFSGLTDVTGDMSAVMRKDDQLTVRCTFNNTDASFLRIG